MANPDYLQWTADWLMGLLEANRSSRVYPQRSLAGVIAQTGLETCARGVRQLGLGTVLSRIGRVPWLTPFGSSVAENLLVAAGSQR